MCMNLAYGTIVVISSNTTFCCKCQDVILGGFFVCVMLSLFIYFEGSLCNLATVNDGAVPQECSYLFKGLLSFLLAIHPEMYSRE